jgi:tRNA dimethylallyltransferase
VAGGTGLYVRGLLLGLFAGPPADANVRALLADEAGARGGPRALWDRLARVDAETAARIDPNDLIRITRALEVYLVSGITMSEHQRRHDHRRVPLRYPARIIGLFPPPSTLYPRIDARVEAMLEAGLLAEVQALRRAGFGRNDLSQQAIGYAELHDHLDGVLAFPLAVQHIKRNSRRYARRQASWYRSWNRPDLLVERHADASRVDLAALERYLRG